MGVSSSTVFLALQLEGLGVNGGRADLKGGLGANLRGRGCGGAAKQGVNPRQQFPDAEGLGDVIIGAEVEPDHLVEFLAFGGEHQDGRGDFLRAKLLADVVAAQARQHDIQHDQRGAVLLDGFDRLVSAVADGHVEPVALQDFLQAEEDVRVVFNDKNFCLHRNLWQALASSGDSRGPTVGAVV